MENSSLKMLNGWVCMLNSCSFLSRLGNIRYESGVMQVLRLFDVCFMRQQVGHYI